MRTVLVAGVMAAGAGMLAFLLILLWEMRGYLALTLLGRYILVRISGIHWGMVGVVLGVGALATAYPARVVARMPPAEAVRGE